MPIHGNGNHLVYLLFDIAGDSLTFVTDYEGQLSSCIPLMRRRPLHICTENPKTNFLELVQGLAEIGHTGNGNMLNGTR